MKSLHRHRRYYTFFMYAGEVLEQGMQWFAFAQYAAAGVPPHLLVAIVHVRIVGTVYCLVACVYCVMCYGYLHFLHRALVALCMPIYAGQTRVRARKY